MIIISKLKQQLAALFGRVLFLGVCSVAMVQGDELSQNEAELKAVTEELTQLQQALAKSEQAASSQQKALRQVETELGQVQRTIGQLKTQLGAQHQRVEQLKSDQIELSSRLAAKESEIQAILRLAYKQNNQPLIKLLLSGERPESLSRHLYYFSKLTETQQTVLANWIDDQNRLSATIEAQQQALLDIERKQSQLVQNETELVQQKNRRAQVVKNLTTEALDAKKEIERKQAEREKLTELIAELKNRVESFNLDFPSATEIGKVRGQLAWPVDGRLTNSFGRSINGSALKWQGWLIAAPDGQPVKAVHGGRILFADFFKSNGLLIILDHGDGVWTLYGRNQTLLRDVGSWVNAGDVIAEVGRSGGYNESGLYFEVRSKGEPQNPAKWLQKR